MEALENWIWWSHKTRNKSERIHSDWRTQLLCKCSLTICEYVRSFLRQTRRYRAQKCLKAAEACRISWLLRDVSNVQRVWAESFPQTKWIKKNKETHVSAAFALVPLPLVLVDVCFCVLIKFAPACIQCDPDKKRLNWWSDVLVANDTDVLPRDSPKIDPTSTCMHKFDIELCGCRTL